MTLDGRVAIQKCDSYKLSSVSKALDDLFEALGLPKENPFGAFIKPGMTVFIKPNWVASRWRESCDHIDDLYCVITHPHVIEAVADRVALALNGKGKIIIADSPSIDADFDELMVHTGIKKLEKKYDVSCEIFDLRPLVCPSLDVYGKRDKMVRKTGDPYGEVKINLGRSSLLSSVDSSLFRGVFDEREETVASHTGDKQLYTFSRSMYNADVYISIPKLKTHQKVGATLNLKGLVGSITDKNQLVHWRVGYPEVGGDEYPDKQSYEASKKAEVTHRGSWPGNDTIWRMVCDLYGCLLKNTSQTRFSIIDGIMGGEGQGPFCVTAKYSSCLIAGADLLQTDAVAVRYMGIDPKRIKYLNWFIEKEKVDLNRNVEVLIDGAVKQDYFNSCDPYKDFYVVDKWAGIKVDSRSTSNSF